MAQAAQNLHSHSQPPRKAGVLLVTVTEIEAKAVLNLFPDYTICRIRPESRTYYDLGIVNDTRIFMVQSVEMGVSGAGGALLTVLEALLALSPSTVIMVGIAFGLKPAEQKIGDILVSTQICDYNQQKVDTDAGGQTIIVSRGNRIPAPTRLLDKFRAGAKDWPCQANIHFGPILSSEKLVNNLEYRDQLRQLEPDAIGGEMEGAALGSAEQRRKADWILVKAICDWADGNKEEEKDERQKEAAHNAARFALHVIRQGNLASQEGLPPQWGKLLCTFEGHAQWVLALSWQPLAQGGQRIASTGGDGTVRVWDAETAQCLVTYRGHQYRDIMARTPFLPTVYNVAWSPVDARIASCGKGNAVHVWNADTGGKITLYQDHSGLLPSVYAAAWSPDGSLIASACSNTGIDKTIHIWNVHTGQTIHRCETYAGLSLNFSVLALAWSPDGSRIAASCGKTIQLWNAATGERIHIYHVSSAWASHLAWSTDSRFLAVASSDKTAQIWDTSTHQLVLTYRGHNESVRAVAWSPDSSRIASASNDKTVQVWDAASGTHIFTYEGHKDWTTSVAWSPDGSRIASASNDKTIQVWQAL